MKHVSLDWLCKTKLVFFVKNQQHSLEVFRLNIQPRLISMYEAGNKIRIPAIPTSDWAFYC
jgi:hypothetical protein